MKTAELTVRLPEEDIEFARNTLVDQPEKADELLVAMLGLAVGNHPAVGDVEGGKQGCGAVSNVVMGYTLYIAKIHRQHRLAAFESLALALLIHTQHHRVLWWIQV